MASNLIYDESNWLFPDPQNNEIHDITIDDMNQLLSYADQDEAWAEAVKSEVVEIKLSGVEHLQRKLTGSLKSFR